MLVFGEGELSADVLGDRVVQEGVRNEVHELSIAPDGLGAFTVEAGDCCTGAPPARGRNEAWLRPLGYRRGIAGVVG